MNRYLVCIMATLLTGIAAYLASCLGSLPPTSSNENINVPEPGPDDTLNLPAEWGNEDCGYSSAVDHGPVVVNAATPGYVWAGLFRAGTLVGYGQGYSVPAGQDSLPNIRSVITNPNIGSGEFQYVVFLCDSIGQVGRPEARRIQSRPRFDTLSLGGAAFSQCIGLLQGDTVYLNVAWNGHAYEIQKSSDFQFGYNWTVKRLKDSTVDTVSIPQLDDPGTFFPLRVTQRDSGRGWFIQASQGSFVVAEIEVHVLKADSLGAYGYRTDYDSLIAWWANVYAVPVSLFKSQVNKESAGFRTNAFRYEPCNVDKPQLESPGTIKSTPYNHYNLMIPASWLNGPYRRGDKLVADDTVRCTQLYGGAPALDKLNQDGCISAGEYITYRPTENWGNCTSSGDWIAQTTVASSYGLSQIMYTTAVQPGKWNGGNGGNPSRLFDPSLSLQLGARYLRKCFDKDTSGAWDSRWRKALARYNSGYDATDLSPSYPYADDILAHEADYQPRR